MRPNRHALALAVLACVIPSAANPGSTPAFDPLLDGGASCAPLAAGQPALLRSLIVAAAGETVPYKPGAAAPAAGKPVLYNNLGSLSFKATQQPQAQAWFNQGMRLAFAFNHAEAQRAFREAQALDPKCALCYWGEALVLGPNINLPMMPDANAPALAALAKAVELAPSASPRDRALIQALAARYSADPKAERPALDAAYAEAMKQVAARYAGDDTVQVLWVESMMDTQPWDYWEAGGTKPKGHGAEIVGTLETVLKRNPNHPGAIHLYIHAVEASTQPQKALAYADRLGAADARSWTHRAHAGAHLLPRRHVPQVARREQAGDGGRRTLFCLLPIGSDLQGGVLPAQHSFPDGLGADGRRRANRDPRR